MNQTERLAYEFLINERGRDPGELVREHPQQNPDFIWPDESYEVKRKQGEKILVSPKQQAVFDDIDPIILVMHEDRPEPIEEFRWSHRDDHWVSTHIWERPNTSTIHFNDEETWVSWQELLAGYDTNEQALKDVIDVWRSYPSFFSRRKGKKSPD